MSSRMDDIALAGVLNECTAFKAKTLKQREPHANNLVSDLVPVRTIVDVEGDTTQAPHFNSLQYSTLELYELIFYSQSLHICYIHPVPVRLAAGLATEFARLAARLAFGVPRGVLRSPKKRCDWL